MKQGIYRRFARYVLPSVTGMLVSSLYVVVDGIFVGRFIGADGIAAINLIWPFIAVFIAVTMMIGIGGAALMSHALGAGEQEKAKGIFHQSLWLLLAFSAVFSLCGMLLPQFFCRLMGADEAILPMCVDYLRWYMLFGVPYGLSMGLAAFVRNDNNPNLAFGAMVVGSLINVVLDYVAIVPLKGGMMGAAAASGMGQAICAVLLLFHFVGKKGVLNIRLPRPNIRSMKNILSTGSPELMVNLCCPVSMLAYNYTLMHTVGADGVAAYGIIAYILTIFTSLFTGVSQGIQPILCYSRGAGDEHALQRFFRMGITVNLSLAVAVFLALRVWDGLVISIFTTDPVITAMTMEAFGIYSLSFLFGSVNVVCITYFLSTGQTRLANLLSFSRGVVLVLLFIVVLPPVFGIMGIWGTMTAAECMTFLIAMVSFWILRREP
ncbi:MAG: MATE family efflux transporter [Angelakisella sp.]